MCLDSIDVHHYSLSVYFRVDPPLHKATHVPCLLHTDVDHASETVQKRADSAFQGFHIVVLPGKGVVLELADKCLRMIELLVPNEEPAAAQ